MGKGDKKSRRGKIIMGSFGVRRRRKKADKQEIKAVTVAKDITPKDKKPLKEKKEVKEVKEVKQVKPVKEVKEIQEVKEVKVTKAVKQKTPAKAPKTPAKAPKTVKEKTEVKEAAAAKRLKT